MFIKSFWKVFVCTMVIVVLSCIPANELSEQNFLTIPHLDKLAHLLMYFILSFLLIQGLMNYTRFSRLNTRLIVVTLVLILVFGSLLEAVQEILIASRNGDLLDILFNLLGFLLTILLLVTFRKRFFSLVK